MVEPEDERFPVGTHSTGNDFRMDFNPYWLRCLAVVVFELHRLCELFAKMNVQLAVGTVGVLDLLAR